MYLKDKCSTHPSKINILTFNLEHTILNNFTTVLPFGLLHSTHPRLAGSKCVRSAYMDSSKGRMCHPWFPWSSTPRCILPCASIR